MIPNVVHYSTVFIVQARRLQNVFIHLPSMLSE